MCGLTFDPKLAAPDAHCNCLFGKWYYGQDDIRDDVLFQEIGRTHQAFHGIGSSILQATAVGGAVDQEKYDGFMSIVVAFNDQLRRLQTELWGKISSSDPLTGLPSWHRMLTPVGTDMGDTSGKTQNSCAAMCDLDHFKRINDTYGHQAGDEVLRRLGACLQDGLRPSDLVYRYGGEEFLVYLGGASLEEAALACDRLRVAVGKIIFELPTFAPFAVTASFGVARVEKNLSIDDVVTRCDLALYAAKGNGRNRVYCWEGGEVRAYERPASEA
ncbi:MAG: diguanylate cyclase [Alphaproteobacteria bacterium]|nr:diguanylate cyclase [Alphaproteobacteria bacterium]